MHPYPDSRKSRPFAPWKPFWFFLRILGYFAAILGVSVACLWFCEILFGMVGIIAVICYPLLIVGFVGVSFGAFAGIISLWIGACTRCPKCGSIFAGRYFATECSNCHISLQELESMPNIDSRTTNR
ncbi:hypothetical protein ETAA8_26660 [Anatilimnocola aggregata]|uniref:Uncharacterized protein n=1 Tax=Anatilimnocola aggregata TaxID=2528021 RepID=A0A517YBG0_9BACT|nr:hypothetical protein ETAA8_26660 [Anatilimnocola aggregata]